MKAFYFIEADQRCSQLLEFDSLAGNGEVAPSLHLMRPHCSTSRALVVAEG